MTTLREAAQQALEALNSIDVGYRSPSGTPLEASFDEGKCEAAITALRAALAQQDPEFLVTNCTLWGSPPKPHEYWSEFFSAMVETRTLAGVFISDAALAQQAEPVAWIDIEEDGTRHCLRSWSDGTHREHALCAAPPQRKWQGLTEEEIQSIHDTYHKRMGPQEFARAIEAALKEKNA